MPMEERNGEQVKRKSTFQAFMREESGQASTMD